MKVWFFLLVTLGLLVSAPKAAGAGVELTGLGGVQMLRGDDGGLTGTLRMHVMASPSASAGIDVGYARMGDEIWYVGLPGTPTRPPYESQGRRHLAWLSGSFKARTASRGDAHPYLVMMLGVSDHITRGPGYSPLETYHHGRFHMALAFGVEGDDRLGPVLELRTFATGLDRGGALGVSASVGVRFAP